MGSTKPNGGDGDDEDPRELAGEPWMELLDETDEVYSLKPLEEVLEMKANKVNIARACREFMRQAWGECYTIVNDPFLSSI